MPGIVHANPSLLVRAPANPPNPQPTSSNETAAWWRRINCSTLENGEHFVVSQCQIRIVTPIHAARSRSVKRECLRIVVLQCGGYAIHVRSMSYAAEVAKSKSG